MNTLPIDMLKEYLFYDAKTGEFYWIKSPATRIKVGTRAGYLHLGKYRQIKLCGVRLLLHRVAWAITYGEWPEKEIDHIRGWEAGDRILNLRVATRQENLFNRRPSNKTSAYKGVSWDKRARRWLAQATLNNKTRCLGRFDTEEAAAEAYLDFARAHHGAFFHLPYALQ